MLGADDEARVQAAWRALGSGARSGAAGAHARGSRHRALRECARRTGCSTWDSLPPIPAARRPITSRSSHGARSKAPQSASSRCGTYSHPPGRSDWITAEGRRKLAAYGIVPPAPRCGLVLARCGRRPAGRLSAMPLGAHRIRSANSARLRARRCTVVATVWSRSSASSACDG